MRSSDRLQTLHRTFPPAETAHARQLAMSPSETGMVLIVDDEEPIAETLAMIVTEAGYKAQVAGHGKDALAMARARWPALVITDMMMPYLDGAGLIAALRDEARSGRDRLMPIIVMTAANIDALRRTGADAILRKPFDITEVEALLRRFLPYD